MNKRTAKITLNKHPRKCLNLRNRHYIEKNHNGSYALVRFYLVGEGMNAFAECKNILENTTFGKCWNTAKSNNLI